MAYGICLGTSSWGQDESGATGGIKASHRSWNVVVWHVESTDELWIPRSKSSPTSPFCVAFAAHFADETQETLQTLVLCLFLFSIIVKATTVDATTTGPTCNWCWTSSDLPAESPKSSHHHQEVKDRILPLVNVASFHNTKNHLSCNHSLGHQHTAHWDHDLEQKGCSVSLQYCTVLQCKRSLSAHRVSGDNGSQSHLPPNPFSPDCSDWTRVPTLRTSDSEQRRPQPFSAAGCVFVAFLRSAFGYKEKHFHCTAAMCRWACYRQWWWQVFLLLLTVTKKVA